MKFFHGAGRHGPYFEGWYLKHQAPNGGAVSVIPAYHIDAAGRRSASLQVVTQDGSWSLPYPGNALQAGTDFFQIWLGGNLFNTKGLWLDLSAAGLEVHGELRYGPFTPLKRDIMGPFRFVPGMQCSHSILSMGHRLEGILTVNGKTIDFTGGTGYIEADRGKSFPSSYLWTQCAWREERSNSLILSVAHIPIPGGSFTGCICAVLYRGREYRLATYHGAKVERWNAGGVALSQGPYRLVAELIEAHPLPLRAPVEGAMGRTVHESLCAMVRYRFWRGETLLFDCLNSRASYECAGIGESNEAVLSK